MSFCDPYRRLLEYFDSEVAKGEEGAYDSNPVDYEGSDSKVKILQLVARGLEAVKVFVAEEDMQVAWFELHLGCRIRITLDKMYPGETATQLNALLLQYGI